MSAASGLDLPELPSVSPTRGRIVLGFAAVLFGFCGLVAWLFLANLAGAVVAPGSVVVESNIKKVQHQAGGIIGEIHVRSGQRVAAGDLLVRLDETIPRTNLGQIDTQITQLTGRRARLEAERDGRSRLDLPQGFAASSAQAATVVLGEQRLLDEERATRAQQVSQLGERIGQFQREIEGLAAQIEANARQASLIREELKGVKDLFDRNLVPMTRLTALQREAARLDGENGSLKAATAKTEGQIAEIRLQLLTIEQRARSEAVKELREVETQIAQLSERRIASLDILRRVEIRAPQSGFVHELNVHTIGGVISPGETLMQIVPDSDRLAVEIRVSPTDIDHIRLGQPVLLRLSAFNQRTTPELRASITGIAADISREQQTGLVFYVARAMAEPAELEKLKGLVLTPGMPVEAFVETGDRTALSYFAKPLTDAFARAFREE
jgi:HlyD family secretion protein